jgi:hypothetical protein
MLGDLTTGYSSSSFNYISADRDLSTWSLYQKGQGQCLVLDSIHISAGVPLSSGHYLRNSPGASLPVLLLGTELVEGG